AVHGRHNRNAKIDEAPFIANAEAAVLGDAALGDIEFAHYFNAREDGGVPLLGKSLHGVLQHTVDAVLDDDFGVARLDVNVTGAALERGEDDGVNEANDRAHAGIARELVHGDVFVAVFFVANDLKGEAFGGLIENALGLLGAFQEIVNLRRSSDFNLQALIQQKREFVGLL